MNTEQNGDEDGQAEQTEDVPAQDLGEEEPTEVEAAPQDDAPTVVDPEIALEVFAQVSGRRPDQIRGFTLWAKKEGFKKKTRPQWEAEWKRYLERPV